MITLEIDASAFERRAKEMKKQIEQVPYALAIAMNRAVENTHQLLVESTWRDHVTERNKSFIGRALRAKKAHKGNLRVEIFDSLGRAHLKLHDTGGIKTAKGRLAIPQAGAVRRGASGVRKSQRPRAIVLNTPKRALRITAKGIFVGKGGRLQLMYAFASSANIRADVPFEEDFRTAMVAELRTSFPAAISNAMKRRRK